MIRTLHTYISRDLVRVGTLALIAFTLVLTVFSIIEPMRRQGLAPEQVLSLFGYTVPVMLTLTLPIASLFATTIVYGRMSQDNEILACRASGISLVTLMRPAFVLGALVTVISLILSFQVTPHMAARMAMAAKASIREIVYHKLRTENSFDYAGFIIHADRVDPERNIIQGIVVADEKRKRTKGTAALYAASTAYVQFAGEGSEDESQKYVTFEFDDGVPLSPDTLQVPQPRRFKASAPLPRVMKEEPSWYDLAKLRQTLRRPVENAEIREALANVRRLMRYDQVAHELAETAKAGQPYLQLRRTDREKLDYVIRSVTAQVGAPGQVVLRSYPRASQPGEVELAGWSALARLAHDSLLRVEVLEVRNGRILQRIVGDEGRVLPTQPGGIVPSEGFLITSPGEQAAATIEVTGRTSRTRFDLGDTNRIRAASWQTGKAEVPRSILDQTDRVALNDIFDNPGKLGLSPPLRKALSEIKTYALARLKNHIIAELNSRSAYCLSCFLLVILGGALGVLFRGGQVISAFALSVAPAAVVIVLILMGKQMIRNPDVSVQAGLVSIWSGLVVLIVANLFVYRKLTRS